MNNSDLKPGDKVRVTDKVGFLFMGHEYWKNYIVTIEKCGVIMAEIKEFIEDSSLYPAIPIDRLEKVIDIPEHLFEIE